MATDAEEVPDGDPQSPREICLEWFREQRFGDSITCLECGSAEVSRRGRTRPGAREYECLTCGHKFNDFTGTSLNNSRMSVESLFHILRTYETATDAAIGRDLGRNKSSIAYIRRGIEADELLSSLTIPDRIVSLDLPAVAPDVDTDRVEKAALPVESTTRDRLAAWKEPHDWTYEEAVIALLDRVGEEPTAAEAAAAIGGRERTGFDNRTTITITKPTRKRLKVWKVERDLRYDEALRALLALVDDP